MATAKQKIDEAPSDQPTEVVTEPQSSTINVDTPQTLNRVYNKVKLVHHDGKLIEGPTIKTGIKIDPERAERMNAQEANTLVRFVLKN